MKENTLRPVIFVKGEYSYHRQNLFQQNLLLKALQVTQDPQELKRMIGVKTVAEVYRTLDKMAIRKEYHEALLRKGMDLDNIIAGIKREAEESDSSAVRLDAYKTILRSLGLHEYKESVQESSRTWEDVLLEQGEQKVLEGKTEEPQFVEYEVIEPEIPKEVKERIEKEQEIGKGLYE